MPISRKPKERDLETFIAKGGSEPIEQKKDQGVEKTVQSLKLRIPTELLEEIDQLVASRRPSPSRHQWILEALYEKVEREELSK
ncbi:hypothetical protein [Crocosphaera sp. XPORK-15E]|uniref:hypothetical protein n=1 Tax=Crocosphaera sp. XPORK-15E TaxID=3110247 RepID=UPI002B207569|nr:hypothetical protein [Crocosphaera sp. XPORK-15E]MEA5537064.1 hypothetical protein [Crocosphaera sp. XPORK-15E]